MTCLHCRHDKPAGDFYILRGQRNNVCKACHNRRCAARVRGDAAYAARQYSAKRRWTLANPEAKAIHEGRAIFLGMPSAPAKLVECERLILAIHAAAPA